VSFHEKVIAISSAVAAVAAIFVVISPAAIASSANTPANPCPTSWGSNGYCRFESPGYTGYFIYDDDNVVIGNVNDTPYKFLNPGTWNHQTTWEMFEAPTGRCITWEQSNNTFREDTCVIGDADQEFVYSATDHTLLNVGATGYNGRYYCLHIPDPNDTNKLNAVTCTWPLPYITWNEYAGG
jgi:hypothetical protein